MTTDDFDNIASALGIRLPEFYCRFMLQQSSELKSIEQSMPERAMLFYAPGNVIYYNRLVRDEPIGREGLAWPAEHFIVGVHFCQDYWTIKLDGSDQHMWTCWSDSCTIEKEFETLDHFLQQLCDDQKRPAE